MLLLVGGGAEVGRVIERTRVHQVHAVQLIGNVQGEVNEVNTLRELNYAAAHQTVTSSSAATSGCQLTKCSPTGNVYQTSSKHCSASIERVRDQDESGC